MFDLGRETTFGSSYREFRKTKGSRNRDSPVNQLVLVESLFNFDLGSHIVDMDYSLLKSM